MNTGIQTRLNPITGYTGIFKQPIQDTASYGPTVYCVADPTKKEVCIIPLVPGFYQDVYRYASLVTNEEVTIFIPSLDILFISDMFNLIMNLRNVKKSLRWVFPDRPEISSSIEFLNLQNVASSYDHTVDSRLSIEYIKDTYIPDRTVYDIIVRDGTKTIYLTSYMTAEKAKALNDNIAYTEIHVPFSSTLYGGLSYIDIVKLDGPYRKKFVINCFTSVDEYEVYGGSDLTPYRQGRMCYNDIIS